jgi:hypothetical protein
MQQLNELTLNYVANTIEIAGKNMPKDSDKLKSQYENKEGVFNLLPIDPLEIAEMLRIYHAYKFPKPDWITQYEVRDKFNKGVELINTMVKDGRLRSKEESDKTLYAKDDLVHLQKFDLLFGLLESKDLTKNLNYPAINLSCYTRYNIKEKGKDLGLGQIQVMDILQNELMEIRIVDPEFRNKLRSYLDNFENK